MDITAWTRKWVAWTLLQASPLVWGHWAHVQPLCGLKARPGVGRGEERSPLGPCPLL